MQETILSTRAMEHEHNATSNPPFGAMQPETFNPVATLPPPVSSPDPLIHKRVTRGRFERQSVLAGLEVSRDEKSNDHPSTEIIRQWTVTPTSQSSRPKRNPQEHDFRLSAGGHGNSSSHQVMRSKREMVTKSQEKEAMMEVSTVAAMGRGNAFVEEKTDPEDTSGHRGTKAVRRRAVTSTTKKRTTTEDLVASGQERPGESGVVIPGVFIGA